MLNWANRGSIIAIASLGLNLTVGMLSPEIFAPISAVQAQDQEERTNIRVYEAASPAVVSIEAANTSGSGSIITSDGLVLTNAHVVQGSNTVTVILADGRRLSGNVIGFGERGLDLAMIRLRGAQGLPTVRLATPGSVKVGQRAFAIGNPFGQFQGTFTTGIVSRLDAEKGLIQTDAAINPGNSGGPLLNSQGEMIGVNTAIFTRGSGAGNIGIGFAIAIEQVRPFIVAAQENRASPTSQLRQAPGNTDRPPQALALNSAPIRGTLAQGDNVLAVDNSYFDVYAFEGRAGMTVDVQMNGQGLDPYLILIGPGGQEIAQDDDSGGNYNARIRAVLPVDGSYLIVANSYQGGESGTYSLQARSSSGQSQARRSSPPSSSGILLQRQGVLGPGAQVMRSDGSLYDEYVFEGQAGQTITMTLQSPDFDTYLILVDESGRKIGENDDASPTSTDSQLRLTLPRGGVYRAIVNAYDRGGRGRYLLTIQ
ncbi:MAG: trypsin-like peptidase domain-containing protein [Jaaginema sp. PMC 1078.18]|nr:trypsin-like peptidase domain-containing protein [Jaaginema sp. PMC 1078.18]